MRGCRRSLLLVLGIGGCTIITDFSPDRALERSEERCSDRVDNDGNGLTDCQDPSCKIFDFCNESTDARCSDGLDNDADGAVDCRDVDCCSQPRCASEPICGERTLAACQDGRDNDLNGLTDCADFSCEAVSECCTRPMPILAESFDAGSPACAPLDCRSQLELCCSKAVPPCNPLDPSRWLSFGNPAPRLLTGELTPNQPCPACAVSGIISVTDAELAPHLYLELDLELHGDVTGSLSVGLVQQAVLPGGSSATCGGVQAPFPLLAGFSIDAGQVAAIVGGAARATTSASPQARQQLALEVTSNGSLRYYLDGHLFHQATGAVLEPYPRVRLLVQGHSATAAVDNLLLARRVGCPTLDCWLSGPRGPGPVLSPPVESEGRFDASSLTDPALLWTQQGLRLYYAGASAKMPGQSKLGRASSEDGQTWTLSKEPIVIVGEDAPALSGPTLLNRTPTLPGLLMAYTARSGDGTSRIGLAESVDGLAWKRVAIAVERGAPGRWDDDEVSAPALVSYRHQLHLYYAGRGKSSPLPALGLALAPELAGGAPLFAKLDDPVLRPGVGTHDERGITDPALLPGEDVLHLYYVGLTWGGGTQINLCASEDGRNWVRHPKNPILGAGVPALFGGELRAPSLIERWGTIHLWYGAPNPAGLPSIGYAVNPVVLP